MSDQILQDFYSSNKESDEVDVGKVFRLLLMQSRLIILIVSSAFFLSFLNYSFSVKTYLIQSLIQYETFNNDIFDPSQSIQSASASSSSDISNLTELYESRTNFLKVITDLKLNIDFNDLHDSESIDIEIYSNNKNSLEEYKLIFSFSENDYSLLDKNLNKIKTTEYGNEIIFNDLVITIFSSNLKDSRSIEVYFKPAHNLYTSLKSNIKVESNTSRNAFFKNEGLITISYVTDDMTKGREIINYANNIFLNQRVNVETEKSRKAIDFIDRNIKSIGMIVEEKKLKLKEFREINKSIDVGLETEAIVNKIESLNESLRSIDIEIGNAQELYTSNNPFYQNLLNKKILIKRQKELVTSEIEKMPKEQQEYIDLYKDLESSQIILEELESRRLGFSILEASTIADVRIVDDAYVVSNVGPRLLTVFIVSFMSLVLACFIAIIRGTYLLPLSNPAEIFDNNIHIPILGVIPEVDDVQSSKDLGLNSSIESLIVSVESMQKNKPLENLITITSASSSNGKSTIAVKLASGLSKIGKKVLLVDNDLKRGKLNKNFNVKNISEKEFYSIDESSINNYKVNDNLYLIPRVEKLNDTFQFLYSYNYTEKIKFLKSNFDYIIFDTAPILSVADTSILVDKSDLNHVTVRHGINKINEIKQIIDSFKQISKKVDGILYNAYAKPNGYYGYYGIYGNYQYQYYAERYLDENYGYNEED